MPPYSPLLCPALLIPSLPLLGILCNSQFTTMNSVSAHLAASFTGSHHRKARFRAPAVAVAVAVAAPAPARGATMYDVLSVGETAGAEEIKAAYRRAARQWHPDVCRVGGAAERFKMAREAYEVLSDPARRRGYDLGLRAAGDWEGGGARGRAAGVRFGDWEAQLAGLQWRAAARRAAGEESWASRVRRAHGQP